MTGHCCLTRMDATEEAISFMNKIWVKLHGLPNATPVDLAAFFIILTFICELSLSFITHYWVSLKTLLILMLFHFSDGFAHDCADLHELLLLLLSQDKDEGLKHMKNYALLCKKSNRVWWGKDKKNNNLKSHFANKHFINKLMQHLFRGQRGDQPLNNKTPGNKRKIM